MTLERTIDKYFYHNVTEEIQSPGLFVYEDICNYVKQTVQNGENLGVLLYVETMKNRYKKSWNYYSSKISNECNRSIEEVNEELESRLSRAFYGFFGEALLEMMFIRSDRYELLEIKDSKDDYEKAVDVKARRKYGNKRVLYFQVKTLSWLLSPKEWQVRKLKEEADLHEDNKLMVQYVYYRHKFGERYFDINGEKLYIHGYGRVNVSEFDSMMDKVFALYDITIDQFNG